MTLSHALLGSIAFLLLCKPSSRADETPLQIVTLGDSITKGSRPGVGVHQTFASLLEKTLRQNGLSVEVKNVGIGGERTDQALLRLEHDVISLRPRFVTVMYGTNDSYVDRGKTTSRITIEAYEANLRELVKRLQAANIDPILMTEPMFGEDQRKNGAGEDCNLRLGAYMERCRTVARELKVPLVDHFAHWGAVQKRKVKLQSWTTDGCHPNVAGHAEMAHRLVQTLLPMTQRADAWSRDAPYTVQVDTVTTGYDGKMCWVHPRAAALPTQPPSVIMTMQKLLLSGSDIFYALNDTRTEVPTSPAPLKWSPLKEHTDTLGRRDEANGVVVAACDFWPKWHAKSGRVLGIGHNARYQNNAVMHERQRETVYSVYDADKRTWSPWVSMPMPDGVKFSSAGAGSVQRVDLPNGDILLPIYFKAKADKYYRVTVLRCTFDGTSLKLVAQGNDIALADGRGVYEPSLTSSGGKFYLTLRNDNAGYVCVSDDGMTFSEPKKWTWTDGSDLGNYNTQQHWVTHRDDLYLVYTRKGSNNDHVFRHRAPLFMAQIDKSSLQVMRETERILVHERGARLGNFGIVEVSDKETWVTVAEWMQTWGPDIIVRPDNPWGADNSVFAARIFWR